MCHPIILHFGMHPNNGVLTKKTTTIIFHAFSTSPSLHQYPDRATDKQNKHEDSENSRARLIPSSYLRLELG